MPERSSAATLRLWLRVNGQYGGLTCASCFNRKALAAGASPYWEVHDGEFPTCIGSPCVHVAPMKAACEPCAECGHVDYRQLDDILEEAE